MQGKQLGRIALVIILGIGVLYHGNRAVADSSQASEIILEQTRLPFEVPPVNHNGTVMVPMRPIFEALQAKLTWNAAKQTVEAEKDGTVIKLSIGSPFAYIDGRAVVLNEIPYVTEGNTMVPVRFVSEALGASVSWSGEQQQVNITTASTNVPVEQAAEADAVHANYIPSTLTVQFVPSQSAETLLAKSKPLEKLLSDRLGIPVQLSVSTNYKSMRESMAAGKVDISFLPPSGYIYAHDQLHIADVLLQAQRNGVDAATGRSTSQLVDFYQSMFVVKADSSIRTIEDLKGKKVGWQSETSSAGYIYPRLLLEKSGIFPQTETVNTEYKGHDKAVVALLQDQVDAVAVFQDARQIILRDYPNVMQDTRIIAFTDKIPNDVITVRPDMDPTWRKSIKDAFIGLGDDKAGKLIINDVFSHKGYTASEDRKFDIAREADQYFSKEVRAWYK